METIQHTINQINQITDITQQSSIIDDFLKTYHNDIFYIIYKNNKYILISQQELLDTINNKYDIEKIIYPKHFLNNMLFVNNDIAIYCELSLNNENLKIVNNKYWRHIVKKIDFTTD